MKTIIKYATLGIFIAATSLAVVSPGAAQSNGKGSQSAGANNNNNDGGRSDGGRDDGGDGGGGEGPVSIIRCVAPCNPEREIIVQIPKPRPTPTVAQHDGNECQWLYNQITTNNMLVTVPRYNRCVEQSGG